MKQYIQSQIQEKKQVIINKVFFEVPEKIKPEMNKNHLPALSLSMNLRLILQW